MNRKTLTTAVIAGVAGVAGVASISNAVNLNPDGLGQVLIYPYYTVNAGNVTLLSIVNTTDTVKAVKVRFVESKNSAEVLDFNLYMSPFDVWTGAVLDASFAEGGDADAQNAGLASVATKDNSCTVPSFFAQSDGSFVDAEGDTQFYVNFKTLRLAPELCTGGICDISPERTREGHFEMIEMGVVEETEDATVTGLEAAAIHTGAGVPLNCGALVSAWIDAGVGGTGFWITEPNTDMLQPAGGLFGGAAIIDVAEGYEVSYNADAIDAFYADTDTTLWNAVDESVAGDGTGGDTLHAQPGDERPRLSQAQTGLKAASVASIVYDNGAVVASSWDLTISSLSGGRIDAVSALYMHNEIYNEYATLAVNNGKTEWVITQPTKRFYVNNIVTGPIDPYTTLFDDTIQPLGGACEPIGIGYTDREEGDPGIAPGSVNFSPVNIFTPGAPTLCYEAQVVTFNFVPAGEKAHLQQVLGSPFSQNIATTTVVGGQYDTGWTTINFTTAIAGLDHSMTDDALGVYLGLPVTGFAVQVVSNGEIASDSGTVLSSYAGLYGHRADRSYTP